MSPQQPVSSQQPVNAHRIRLPAPWRATRSPEPAGACVIFRRSFQRPTGLAGQSTIALEITLLEPLSLTVALNRHARSAVRRSDLVFEVPLSADQLQPVNELEVRIQLPDGAIAIEQPKFGEDYIAQVALVLY